MYIGSFILKIVSIRSLWAKHEDRQIDISFHGLKSGFKTSSTGWFQVFKKNSVWRMYIMVSLLF
ncbi:hypothetical protein Hdeb2414_s0024g00646991 [Helianthus debilis subsp. tardiflorus]